MLYRHPDRLFSALICNIILRGAKLGYQDPERFEVNQNHASVKEAPDILAKDIKRQMKAGRLLILTAPLPTKHFSSPLGLVPKHDGGWRRIHDLSYPAGASVNEGIPKDWGALEYAVIDKAITAILTYAGLGAAILLKEDLADAFRHIAVAISDRWLLGFSWLGIYYIECFLPFGLRTAPLLFDLFARGLHYILAVELCWSIVLYYIDNFLTILRPYTDPAAYKSEFEATCQMLGLKRHPDEEESGTCIEFLGIELDTVAMEARLPLKKLERARQLVVDVIEADGVPLAKLETFVGFLSFCAKVVVPGRTFLASPYGALRRKAKIVNITVAMRADLAWWHTFLPRWNGIRIIKHSHVHNTSHIWTDASGKWGIGGHRQAEPTDPIRSWK